MFYVIVVVVERLSQFWPLIILAFTSIAVCHLALKLSVTNGNKLIGEPQKKQKVIENHHHLTATTETAISDTTMPGSKQLSLIKEQMFHKCFPCFEEHPPITVIEIKSGMLRTILIFI